MAQDPRQIILRSAALDQRDIDIARNYAYTLTEVPATRPQ